MNTSILFFLAAFYTSCMSKNFTVIRSRHNSKYYILCVIDICTAENETDLEAVYFSHIFRTVVAQHNFSTVGYIMIEGCKSSCLYSDELLKLLNYDVINKVTAVVALYTASYISFFLDFVFNEFPQISVSKYIDCETSHLTLGGPAPINDILDVLERILISEGWYAFNIFYGPGTMYQDLANKLRSRNEKKWCVDVHFGIGKLQELNKMTYSNVSVILGDLLFLFPLMKELLKVNTVNVQFVMCCLQKDEFQEFMKLHEEMGRIFQNCIFIIMDPVNSSDYSDFLQMYAAQCQNVTSGNDSLPCTSWDKFESLDCEAEIFDYCNFLYENKISYFLQDSHLPDLTDPSKLISLLQRLITVLQHMNESHENMKQLRHFIQEFDFPPNLSWYSFSVIRIEKIDKEYQEVPFEISNEKTRENEGRVFCMRSCIPGEYMELDNLSRCCYSCKSCEPGTYSFGNGTACLNCSEYQWSSGGSPRCLNKSIIYLYWNSFEGIAFVILATAGGVLVIVVLIIYTTHSDTPIVKIAGGFIYHCNLLGLFCCFVSVLFFIGEPDKLKCKYEVPFFALSFSMCLSSVLAKSCRILMAFKSKTGKATKTEKRIYIAIIAIGPLIQALICALWIFLEPQHISEQHDEKSINMICYTDSHIWMALVIGYLDVLALLSCACAIKSKDLPSAFNDANMIAFSMLIFFCVWFCFIPVHATNKSKAVTVMMVIAILASAYGFLASMFLYNCYVILLHPERNTSEWIKQANFNYCVMIANKTSHSILFPERNNTDREENLTLLIQSPNQNTS